MNCRICEAAIDSKHSNSDELKRLQLCFACNFWWEKVEWRINGDVTDKGNSVARINGKHYTIHPSTTYGPQGFGGQLHIIRFDSGEEVHARNLWFQGEIPPRFREHLPNNASFAWSICTCRAKFFPMVPAQTKCLDCTLQAKPKRW